MRKVDLGLLFFFCFFLIQYAATAQISSQTPWVWMRGDNAGQIAGNYGTLRVPAATNKPGSRTMSVSWSSGGNALWLLGGYGSGGGTSTGRLNDLWKYDLTLKQWIWMSGDTVGDRVGVYGTRGVAAASNKPGSRSGSARWIDTAGNLWLFGGFGYAASSRANYMLNDLWLFDTTSKTWTWISGDSATTNPNGVYGQKGVPSAANNPGGRHGAVSWTDKDGNFWLFGGSGYAANGPEGYLNDLWKYDLALKQWIWISGDMTLNQGSVYGVREVPAAGNKPGAREFASGWIDTAGQLWLLGGGDAGGLYNDLWRFNPQTQQWTWMKGDNTPGRVGIYGIKDVANTANQPGARYGAASWRDNYNNFYLLGGIGFGSSGRDGFINDFWKYAPADNSWTWIKGDSLTGAFGIYGTMGQEDPRNMPGARNMSAYWTDHTGGFWIMAGDGFADGGRTTVLNDLWKLENCVKPLSPLSVNGDTQVCAGSTLVYSVPPVEWAISYNWTLPAGWTGSGTGNTIEVIAGTEGGYIEVAASSGCDTSDVLSIEVKVNNPEAIITTEGFVLGTSATFSTYQWLLNERVIQGATQSQYQVDQNGNYRVVVTDELGCVDTSDIYAVNNYPNSGISESYDLKQISIYPNPADEVIFVKAPVPVTVTLSCLDGRIMGVYYRPEHISVKNLVPGIYYISISDDKGNRIKTEKLIRK